MLRNGISKEEAHKRVRKANRAFPDALVENYEPLIEGLALPDPKDRHVLAAAIKINANTIVTNNLKDFPKEYLNTFGLNAKSADDFITDIIDLNQNIALNAFNDMVLNRTNPDLDEFQMLDILIESCASYPKIPTQYSVRLNSSILRCKQRMSLCIQSYYI